MNLGDLEFKAEDGDNYIPPGFVDVVITIERANRLLKERLEKAPKIFIDFEFGVGSVDGPLEPEGKTSHTGRLVCIEDLK